MRAVAYITACAAVFRLASSAITDISSGDVVFLRVSRTGTRLTVTKNKYEVHARWDHTGAWQEITVERLAGPGALHSGDDVYLWSNWQTQYSVEDNFTVHAKWANSGTWEKLTIETKEGGPIVSGSKVFLRAHVGNYIDADPEDRPGEVLARFAERESWQELVIEKKDAPTFAPTTVATTTAIAPTTTAAPTPAPTTEEPTTEAPTTTQASPTTTAPTTTAAPTLAPTTEEPTTTAEPTPAPTTTLPAMSTVSAREWDHFNLLNGLRMAGFTCPGGTVFDPNPQPLRFDCRLRDAAYLHSQDMADNGYFSHYSQNGDSPWDRAAAQGTSANAENIAAGSSTALATLEQWKQSDGHCVNMLNSNYEVMGVGYGYNAESYYRHYWTQMFRNTGEVETWCYPAGALEAQKAINVADKGQGTGRIGEAWRAAENPQQPPSLRGAPLDARSHK
mmetsp:Transcript_112919/g.326188  ORF Transcript_112919/g.326188 Transcript_112919/m.326188 type:complete len:448 (+) Transcript_112919:66-1409(+)